MNAKTDSSSRVTTIPAIPQEAHDDVTIISRMGKSSFRSYSLSESSKSNIRRKAMPKVGPSRNIGAHSKGMGINRVTAPVTRVVIDGSTTNVGNWSFPLA